MIIWRVLENPDKIKIQMMKSGVPFTPLLNCPHILASWMWYVLSVVTRDVEAVDFYAASTASASASASIL